MLKLANRKPVRKGELYHDVLEFKDLKDNWPYIAKNILVDDYVHESGSSRKPSINQTIITFDSETSNYIDDGGNKKPFIFSLMTTIMNPKTNENVNVLCRTIDEFLKLLDAISQHLKTKVNKIPLKNKDKIIQKDVFGNILYDESKDRYINVYIHNLPFDISFLLPKLSIYKVFAQSSHKPYYVVTNGGVQFKDTVVLSQKSLAQIGKSLTTFTERKKVGDFDYDKIRTPKTKFTDKEMGYVTYDTTTLAGYIKEEGTPTEGGDFNIGTIPLTQTGKVRQFVKGVMRGDLKYIKLLTEDGIMQHNEAVDALVNFEHKDGESYDDMVKRYQGIKKKVQTYLGPSGRNYSMTPEQYEEMKRSYTGGFTHSNPNHTEDIMENVQSWDFTSSYPTRILAEKFALSDGSRIYPSNDEFIKKLSNVKDDELFMFDVEFDSIGSKIDYDYFLSVSKCECDPETLVESNGRVVYAEKVKTTMLSTDWETFSKVYRIKNARFSNIYKYGMGYLPLGIILSTIYFYYQKTTLKGIKGRERDYMNYKGMLNSIYGMSVQDPISDYVTYENGEWGGTKKEKFGIQLKNKLIDEYNDSKSRFLFYMWGIQISAYSRRDLWKGIMDCGNDYVYSDTDSIKVINSKKHEKFIKRYNREIINKIRACLRYYGLSEELMNPVDIKGGHHQLGVWDANDGFYSHFKTLGAKRYVDIDKDTHEFEITVAGLSKAKGAKFILNKSKAEHDGRVVTDLSDENVKKLFDCFSDELYVPAKKTGKLAHYYIDHYDSFKVKDYKGEECTIEAGAGCLLKATDFTLSLSGSFKDFLVNLNNGYVCIDKTAKFIL